jgi:hypothetical protein
MAVITTGFHRIDQLIGGIGSGKLLLLSAPDASDLSTLALNLVRHSGVADQLTVGVFTRESKETAVKRLLAATTRVDLDRFSHGLRTAQDIEAITAAAGTLNQARIYIEDTPRLSAEAIYQQTAPLKHSAGLDLVVINSHLRLRQVRGVEMRTRTERLLNELRAVAERLAVPIVVSVPPPSELASQFNHGRDLEGLSGAFAKWISAGERVLFLRRGATSDTPAGPHCHAELFLLSNTAAGSATVDYYPASGCFIDRLPLPDAGLPEALASCRREINLWLASHPEELRRASPRAFEEIIAEVFASQGYDVELTAQTRDGGVDLVAVRKQWPDEEFRLVVECKRYAEHRAVGVEAVRGMAFLLDKYQADRAILATTSYFSRDARKEAGHPSLWRVSLKDFEALREWLQQYRVHLLRTVVD